MGLRQRSRTNPVVIVVLSLVAVALIAVGAYFAIFGMPVGEQSIRPAFQVEGLDPAAKTGRLPGTPRDEKAPSANTFAYRIETTPVFDQAGKNGNINLQNPEYNNYLMVLEIADESGQLLYRSQYLAPNQYLETIDLLAPLQSGGFPAIAYLNAVDPKTLDLVQAFECPLDLTVK